MYMEAYNVWKITKLMWSVLINIIRVIFFSIYSYCKKFSKKSTSSTIFMTKNILRHLGIGFKYIRYRRKDIWIGWNVVSSSLGPSSPTGHYCLVSYSVTNCFIKLKCHNPHLQPLYILSASIHSMHSYTTTCFRIRLSM